MRRVYSDISITKIKNCLDKLEGEVTVICDGDFREISISGIPQNILDEIVSCINKEVNVK